MSVLQDKNIKCAVPAKPDVVKLDNIYRELVLSSLDEDKVVGDPDEAPTPKKIPGVLVSDTASWCPTCNPGLKKD